MGGYIISICVPKYLGIFDEKNAPQLAKSNIGQPPLKSFKKIILSKHRHVGCLFRGNDLQCWQFVLRFKFG